MLKEDTMNEFVLFSLQGFQVHQPVHEDLIESRLLDGHSLLSDVVNLGHNSDGMRGHTDGGVLDYFQHHHEERALMLAG